MSINAGSGNNNGDDLNLLGRTGASQADRDQYNQMLRKLNEFNLSLIQCQQAVEVQEIQLDIPTKLRERLTEVRNSKLALLNSGN